MKKRSPIINLGDTYAVDLTALRVDGLLFSTENTYWTAHGPMPIPEELKRPKPVICAYCRTLEFGLRSRCDACGAPLYPYA